MQQSRIEHSIYLLYNNYIYTFLVRFKKMLFNDLYILLTIFKYGRYIGLFPLNTDKFNKKCIVYTVFVNTIGMLIQATFFVAESRHLYIYGCTACVVLLSISCIKNAIFQRHIWKKFFKRANYLSQFINKRSKIGLIICFSKRAPFYCVFLLYIIMSLYCHYLHNSAIWMICSEILGILLYFQKTVVLVGFIEETSTFIVKRVKYLHKKLNNFRSRRNFYNYGLQEIHEIRYHYKNIFKMIEELSELLGVCILSLYINVFIGIIGIFHFSLILLNSETKLDANIVMQFNGVILYSVSNALFDVYCKRLCMRYG